MSLTTANNEQINLLNAKGSLCRFLVARKEGNIRLFYEEIQKFGKLFLKCPLRKVRFGLGFYWSIEIISFFPGLVLSARV